MCCPQRDDGRWKRHLTRSREETKEFGTRELRGRSFETVCPVEPKHPRISSERRSGHSGDASEPDRPGRHATSLVEHRTFLGSPGVSASGVRSISGLIRARQSLSLPRMGAPASAGRDRCRWVDRDPVRGTPTMIPPANASHLSRRTDQGRERLRRALIKPDRKRTEIRPQRPRRDRRGKNGVHSRVLPCPGLGFLRSW